MRNIIKIGAVLVAAAMIFTGCGDPMVPLTEDEESVVVNYSAGILAKHNAFQQEGITAVYLDEEEAEELEQAEEPEQTEEPEEDKEEGSEESKEESPKEEEQPKEEAAAEGSGQLTLTEALSVPKVEFSYHDYSTTASYKQGDVFSLDASSGKIFLMLNVNMTNTGSEAVECNLLEKQPSFILSVNGEAGVSNQMTMLTNDLSTYVGTLEPGQTEAVILLFEVPEQSAENISTLALSYQSNGQTSEIILK